MSRSGEKRDCLRFVSRQTIASPRRPAARSLRIPVADLPLSTRLRFGGGPHAPRAAREAVVGLLRGRVAAQLADAAELIVSELVTNSVIHARMGPYDSIDVDVALSDGRLRLTVVDDGGECVPHLVDPDPSRPGGKGLLVVERLSAAWGVERKRSGVTRVWCELLPGAL